MSDDPGQDGAAEAFESLRSEIALLRRAIEGLAAERNAAPDYGPTIERLVERQDNVAGVLRRILQSPAVQETREAFEAAVERTSGKAGREGRAAIEHAAEQLRQTAVQLASMIEQPRAAGAQRDALIWTAVLTMGGTGAALAAARILG